MITLFVSSDKDGDDGGGGDDDDHDHDHHHHHVVVVVEFAAVMIFADMRILMAACRPVASLHV